jgi:hypothetical protein
MCDEEKKICDICHAQPATQHICFGGTGETRDLCMTCFVQTASPDELAVHRHSEEVFRTGKCRYCGAPAVGGSIFMGIPGVMDEEANLWCDLCMQDLVEFDGRPENAVPDFPFDDDVTQERVSQQIAERERRRDLFIKEKISNRRS